MTERTIPSWLPELFAGDRSALARAITAVENDTPDAAAVLQAIRPRLGQALVVGFTGAPGAGKSTLVSAYVAELRRRGQSVGVIAVDPSSPITGGALLGDRIRMTVHSTDPGVFVRSLAARGHLGGLSRTAARVADVMDAAGRDLVVIETVGTGQSEVEIADVAEVRVVVVPPGLGDEVQAIKAGILEIADLLVVSKADLPLAARTLRQLETRVGAGDRGVPVLRVSAAKGTGIAELADAIAARRRDRAARAPESMARARRLLAAAVAERLRSRIESGTEAALEQLCRRVLSGEIALDAAAAEALAALRGDSG